MRYCTRNCTPKVVFAPKPGRNCTENYYVYFFLRMHCHFYRFWKKWHQSMRLREFFHGYELRRCKERAAIHFKAWKQYTSAKRSALLFYRYNLMQRAVASWKQAFHTSRIYQQSSALIFRQRVLLNRDKVAKSLGVAEWARYARYWTETSVH